MRKIKGKNGMYNLESTYLFPMMQEKNWRRGWRNSGGRTLISIVWEMVEIGDFTILGREV